MTGIISVIVVYIIAFAALWRFCLSTEKLKSRRENGAYILIFMAAAFALRAVLAMKYRGHETDMNCFTGWSEMMFRDGFKNFYASDAFTDYPPGYMYILYVVGAFNGLLGATDGAAWLVVKLPAIICDIATGWLIYKTANKKCGNITASVISALYLFNPTVILNSSLWGQVDSVFTLFAVLMICLLTERKTIRAYFAFALCIFIKPQSFMFMPLIIFAIIENVFLPEFNKDKFVKNLIGGLCAIAMIFVFALPFGLNEVIEQYKTTLSSYPYMTVNAFNGVHLA